MTNFLFFIWIPLANAVINPTGNELLSKSLGQSHGFSYLNGSNEACPGHCKNGWAYFDETDACYKTFFDANAYDAEHYCNVVGGHLTSIHSPAENMFVAELARMEARGTGRKVWTWTDGTKVDYLAWVVGAPDAPESQRCVMIYSDPRLDSDYYRVFYQKWDDNVCAEKERAFVCKKRALH